MQNCHQKQFSPGYTESKNIICVSYAPQITAAWSSPRVSEICGPCLCSCEPPQSSQGDQQQKSTPAPPKKSKQSSKPSKKKWFRRQLQHKATRGILVPAYNRHISVCQSLVSRLWLWNGRKILKFNETQNYLFFQSIFWEFKKRHVFFFYMRVVIFSQA